MSRDSSPPLPGFEPPSSPPLLPTMTTARKKRARSNSLHAHHVASSDPFVFSSDDAPDDVENYNSPARKKRLFTGPWFAHGQQPDSARTQAKDAFSRNQDSGVWMPSDSSDDSLIEKLAAASTGPPLFGQIPRPSEPDEKPLPAARPRPIPGAPLTEHAVAHAKVHECVDEGNERVDLS